VQAVRRRGKLAPSIDPQHANGAQHRCAIGLFKRLLGLLRISAD
jgi:hypothetical protein